MKFSLIVLIILMSTSLWAQLYVRDDGGTVLMTVSNNGTVGIGDYETTQPLAKLEIEGSGQVMTTKNFDGMTQSILCGQWIEVPFAQSSVMGHYGLLSDVEPPIDKSSSPGQIQSNRSVVGRATSRQNQQLMAAGHLGSYSVILQGLLPSPPTHSYLVTGIRGVVDADEVSSDFTQSDGIATAVMAQVEDNIDTAPHVFALYTTGAKSALNGPVGINTTEPEYDLDVEGDLRVSGTIYADTGPVPIPDYVFEPSYSRLSLSDIQAFIDTQKHLPWIQAATAKQKRIDLMSLNLELLETVENLQLQILDLNKKIEQLETNP